MGIDPKTMYDNMNKKKKKKGSILPLLVVVIIAFLAYQANPEYWQQGRLFQDIKNAGKKKEVETEDIAKIPEKPAEPEVDPDAILDGSIKGAKTIPINIKKQIRKSDPTYEIFRFKFKVIYVLAPKSTASEKLVNDLREQLRSQDLRDYYTVSSRLYEMKDRRTTCEESEPQNFLCKQCDRRICIIHPRKKEYIVVSPTAQSAISRAKAILKEDW